MRHGEAQIVAESDASRPLTAYGREEVIKQSAYLQDQRLDKIVSSPYLRAIETARLIAEQAGYDERIEMLEEITPSGDPDQVGSLLNAMFQSSSLTSLLVVSHQPLVGRLVSSLANLDVFFDTAQICCLKSSFDDDLRYSLEWMR